MPACPVSFRFFVLGLLTQQPMSGYDIKRLLESLGWLVGNPSFGSLYPALHALQQDDLVAVDVDSRRNGPTRKIYSITDTGRQRLQEWISRPAGSNASLRAFVMRLILANNYSQAGLITHLHQRRAQVSSDRDALQQMAEALNDKADLEWHLAADYGMAMASSELTWLNSTLERLFQQPLPMEDLKVTT
jgi:DNA-binding PadR family transcriptional regulator